MTPTGATARRAGARPLERARGFCVWLLLLAAVLASYACQAPALAKLEKKAGTVERDYSDKQRTWEAANVGTELRVGDAVQTLAESSAILGLDDGAQLAMEANTLIRFSATPPKERGLAFDLEIGSAAFSTTDIALSLGTPTEFARLEAGSRVVLSRGPGGLRFVVQVGRAVLDDAALGVGQGVLIDAAGTTTPVAVVAPTAEASAAAKPVGGDVKAVVRGQNASVYADGSWRALPQGSTQLGQGTELKLERNTEVQLTRGDQAATLNQNGRYVVAPRADILVTASAGSLSAGSEGPVRVEVPGGVIVVAPLGKVNVELRGKNAAQLSVEAREAVLETARGTETVRAGEQASLSADGRVEIEGRSLDYADLELQAGESVVIHDPSPPTAVRFLFGDVCSEVGTLQLQGSAQSFAAGRGAVALAMKAGTYRYELRCKSDASSATRRGRVTISKDGGTRAMAVHPPATALEADGRSYTVLYQNRLPELTLTWPSVPAGVAVKLVHEFGGKSETLELGGPSHTFPSGSLQEGKHVFHFTGTGKISRPTSLSILFDNAAPTASLNTPVSLPTRAGDPLTVSGTVLPGWDVQVEGHPAKRDAQGRFSLAAVMPGERRALVIRISHPERGTHVYLRRRAS